MRTMRTCTARAAACALAAGWAAASASAQTIRFAGEPFYNGSTDGDLISDATGLPVTFDPFDPMPSWNAFAAGGQTGGGFVDDEKLVGEAGVQIFGRVSGRAFSTLTLEIDARAWYAPGYFGEAFSTLTGDTPGFGLPYNNFTVEGDGPMPYAVAVTGDVTPDKVEIFDAATDELVTGGTIAPGTYYFTMTTTAVSFSEDTSSHHYQGTWSLTVPTPGVLTALALAVLGASCRRWR